MSHKKITYYQFLNYISSHDVVVRCKTKDEALDFCRHMGMLGVVWFDSLNNINIETYYQDYYENYYEIKIFDSGSKYRCIYGSTDFYTKIGYKILEWSDFDFVYFMPENIEIGNVVVINEKSYIALNNNCENKDLSFYHFSKDEYIFTNFVCFYKSNISDDWCIKNQNNELLYGGVAIDKVYKNINDFKENKNELYNKLIDEKQDMFYCILNSSDEIVIFPNHKNYFDFSFGHTIKIQNNNTDSQNNNNYITISPFQLTPFIAALNELKQMYESHGTNI